VQQRLREAAAAAVAAVGYDHGVFNVELFVLDDGSVKVIEVNPRSAGQFISMYRAVDGFDLERFAIALAAGIDPATLPRRAATAAAAGSFVFRCFDGSAGAPPDPAGVQWLRTAAPEARLWLEPTTKAALHREYRWFGSHRHAVLNLAAADLPSLHEFAAAAARRLFGAASPVR
jgi:biotin carboxylase